MKNSHCKVKLEKDILSEQMERETLSKNLAGNSKDDITAMWNYDCGVNIKEEFALELNITEVVPLEVKVKEEVALEKEGECYTNDVLQFKSDNTTFSNVWDIKTEIKETTLVPDNGREDFVINIKKCTSPDIVDAKIEVKEESLWQKEIQNGVDEDAPVAQSVRLYPEVVCAENLASGLKTENYVTDTCVEEHTGSTNNTSSLNNSDADSCKKQLIFNCDFCEKKFDRMWNLKIHKSIHVGGKLHQCDQCNKPFSRKWDLKAHMYIHSGEKPHKCPNCESSFVRKAELKRHALLHKAENPFRCEVCARRFNHLSHLKRHKLIHAGERPHECEVCYMKFTQQSHLKRHMLLHDGDRRYKCGRCEKSFTNNWQLKIHQFAHDGKKPHRCDLCNKTFTQISHLKRHHMIHKGVKPFTCQVCERSFSQLMHLRRHCKLKNHQGLP